MVSQVQGGVTPSIPPFVSLCYECTHGPYNEPGPGALGPAQAAFRHVGATRDSLTLQGITSDRLSDRARLLSSFDQFRREVDATGKMDAMDTFTQQAMGILTSSKLADALDLSKEDPRIVARYGTGDISKHIDGNGAPRVPQSLSFMQ